MDSVVYALVAAAIVVATVAFIEWFAAWSHKHIMHGWGWGWHKSHHEPHDHALEKNDLYAAVFAGISIVLFWIGTYYWPVWWLAVGITLYGVLYFLLHDGLVHQRWPFKYIPRRGYLKRVYQAHRLHHAVPDKDGCVSFGFIYAKPTDRLLEELKRNQTKAEMTGPASGDGTIEQARP